ncbi:MAG TPA: hypothetical protein PLW72_14475 [Burkholderiaceae bacterium]|nr:hypothetical protein [Burkholderiaceae bacterium]
MFHISEILHGIERRAERAVVHELRLMTHEILSMRTHLSIEHRAHADALLLKLDHLERCQHIQVSGTTEEASAPSPADTATPALPFDDLEALQPSHYLAHFYDHDAGDLDGVALTETLAAAVQLVREHLDERPCPSWQVRHCATSGALSFVSDDEKVLACIAPCDASHPQVEPAVAEACAAFAAGDVLPLQRLFDLELPPAQALAA